MNKSSIKLFRRATNVYRKSFYIPYKIGKKSYYNRINFHNFDFNLFSSIVMQYIDNLRTDDNSHNYLYSASVARETLYASVYSCMTQNLLGKLDNYSDAVREEWIIYFNSFQNDRDGLFYDPAVDNEIYAESDWWGARHLALHMISAYTALGGKPKYQFYFLRKYYSSDAIKCWLDKYDWSSTSLGRDDIDNKIMNVGCLLQYQRDFWHDTEAGEAINHLKSYLVNKSNKMTGMWGGFNPNSPHERSRMVQFAYHLLPLFFYDGDFDFDSDKIVGIILATQNRFGGFGVLPNSSACEDIDSIDLLIRMYPLVSARLQAEIRNSLIKAFDWVLLNQVDDGGFVFRLEEPFRYGSENTSSVANEGAMLPTWFRTLSLAYMARFFGLKTDFVVIRCPGYEF